jgi:excisionase family DNA binding protein
MNPDQSISKSQLMNVEQLARYLQVEVTTIYAWVSRRLIPYRKVGRLLRFDRNEINEWTKSDKRA